MALSLSEEEILQRLKEGKRRVEDGIAIRDAAHCRQYIDNAGFADMEDQEFGDSALPSANTVGGVNDLATDVGIKVDATGLYPPDFYVCCSESHYSPIMRQFMRELWIRNGWVKETRKALLKCAISGLGIVVTTWVRDMGVAMEHVPVAEFACDPYVTNFNNLRWAARRIYLPRAEAEALYPKDKYPNAEFDGANISDEFGERATDFYAEPNSLDLPDTVSMWIYHDKEEEIVMSHTSVIDRQPNLYGRVPYRFIEGNMSPRSAFPLGDFDTAAGIQQQAARLTEALCAQAENGGGFGWYNSSLIADEATVEEFATGRPQGFIPLKGVSPEDAFGYIAGEPLSQALLQAMQLMTRARQAVVGVNGFMRGDNSTEVTFATEAALIGQQSGGRARLFQQKYELLLEDLSRDVIDLYLRFGDAVATATDVDQEFLYAIASIEDIRVIEDSASYRDPEAEMRKAVQLSQVLFPFVQLGVVNPYELAKRIIEASGDKDAETLLLPMLPAQPDTGAEGGVGGKPAPAPNQAPPVAA